MRMALTRNGFAFWALAGVALLISHDAVFLAQMGPGADLAQDLRTAGHGYWGVASLGLALVGLATATAVLLRLRHLRIRAAGLGARTRSARHGYLVRALVCGARLFAVVTIGFMIQESIEHGLMHGHLVGLGALIGPQYPLALPVLGTITLLGGFIAAMVDRVETELVASITDALRRLARAPRRSVRPPLRLSIRRRMTLVHGNAGRAPPGLLVSHT